MARSEAVRGYKSKVRIGVGVTPTWTSLVGVEEFDFPDLTRGTEDATHLDSPNDTEEAIPSMRPVADWEIQIQYKEGNDTDVLLLPLATSGEDVVLELTAGEDGTARKFAAFVRGWRPVGLNSRNKMMATLTMTVMAEVIA